MRRRPLVVGNIDREDKTGFFRLRNRPCDPLVYGP